jgi:ribose 5-phosphate isomerase B
MRFFTRKSFKGKHNSSMLELAFHLMKIAIGADHAGYSLKEELRKRLLTAGHELTDLGTFSDEPADYPEYAAAVGERVAAGEAHRGILVCSTGIGMSIAANKIPGVRAAVAANEEAAQLTRSHNDANVIALGAKFLSPDAAARLVDLFLVTQFDGGERHARRIAKIAAMDGQYQ